MGGHWYYAEPTTEAFIMTKKPAPESSAWSTWTHAKGQSLVKLPRNTKLFDNIANNRFYKAWHRAVSLCSFSSSDIYFLIPDIKKY